MDWEKAIPFDTGWVFVGYYDYKANNFIEGPFAEVVFSPTGSTLGDNIPEIGDILRIRKARNIVIAAYKSEGLKNQYSSPMEVTDVLTGDDFTGIKLTAGTLVVVRAIDQQRFPKKPYSIWCRVVECEMNHPSCDAAVSLVKQRE